MGGSRTRKLGDSPARGDERGRGGPGRPPPPPPMPREAAGSARARPAALTSANMAASTGANGRAEGRRAAIGRGAGGRSLLRALIG